MKSTYDSDGARLSYLDLGSGQPVVFLHPTPFSSGFWLPLIERLKGVRAIVPDLRGHGESELGTGLPSGRFVRVPNAPALTMDRLAGDVLALLDHLRVERAAFVGCSIGGYILLELWRHEPQRMSALAFLCSKPQPDFEPNLLRRAETIAQARSGRVEMLLDGMAQTLIGATVRATHPETAATLRQQMKISAEAFLAVQTGLAVRPDSRTTVSTICVPVLAIAGGEDGAATLAEMEAFRAAPGGCAYSLLSDAGHTAAFEQPDAVAAILNPWLGSLS